MSTDLAILLFALIPATLFALLFGLLVPWYRSAEGWNLFGLTVSIVLLGARSAALRAGVGLPDWLPRLAVALVGIFLWQRLVLLVIRQWPHYAGKHEAPSIPKE